jgi:S-adenosylmethionine hydrolase
MPLITLTTDFGVNHSYVAQMKGVILSIAPSASIIDITHAIAPQDIFGGALTLADSAAWFPPETIHVAVVDPGVGTSRRAIAARIGEHWFVAPDNGLLTGVLRGTSAAATMYYLENRTYFLPTVSPTFHGRDIFSPVAAHLSLGVRGEEFGPPVERLVELDWPTSELSHDQLRGQIIAIDAFGNLISNITRDDVHAWRPRGPIDIHCAGEIIHGITETYGLHDGGQLIALFGSSGRLEIAEAGDSAARRLKAFRGERVELRARV